MLPTRCAPALFIACAAMMLLVCDTSAQLVTDSDLRCSACEISAAAIFRDLQVEANRAASIDIGSRLDGGQASSTKKIPYMRSEAHLTTIFDSLCTDAKLGAELCVDSLLVPPHQLCFKIVQFNADTQYCFLCARLGTPLYSFCFQWRPRSPCQHGKMAFHLRVADKSLSLEQTFHDWEGDSDAPAQEAMCVVARGQ
jgi:hypothetical protein